MKIFFIFEILDYIRKDPSGVTITDAQKGIGASRNTLSKYISILEAKEKNCPSLVLEGINFPYF